VGNVINNKIDKKIIILLHDMNEKRIKEKRKVSFRKTLVYDIEVNLLMIMQVALYSTKNIMIEEKSTEIEGNRFPITR